MPGDGSLRLARLTLLALLVTAAVSGRALSWSFSGHMGAEIDGLAEQFGAGSLFDTRLDTAGSAIGIGTVDQTALALRFRDQTTLASGLLDFRLEQKGDAWFRSQGVIRTGRTRTRGDLETSGGVPTPLGAFSLTNRVFFQGGPAGRGGGADDILTGTLRQRNLPGGIDLRINGSAERSWAGEDSLASIFDYRLLRPSLDLRRPLGLAGDVSLRAGYGRKWTQDGALGAYRDLWGELGWQQTLALRHLWSVSLRSETRHYLMGDSLVPSYQETSLEGQGEIGLPLALRLRLEPELHRLKYATDSQIFHDYWSAETTLRLESSLQDLRRLEKRESGDTADSLLALEELGSAADWTVGLGGRIGVLRHETLRDSDYHTISALASLAREGSDRFWFDLTTEVGRRSYRVPQPNLGFVFEGFNISLTGTDYTFVSTSLLGEITLGGKVRLDMFAMYDREAHAQKSDDFSLWSFTASLTRAF